MTVTAAPPEPTRTRTRRPWLGLGAALAVIAASVYLPTLIGWEVYSRSEPDLPHSVDPLHAFYEPTWWGDGTLPALLIAGLALWLAIDAAERLPWRALLAGTYAVGLAWMVSLAVVRGEQGLSAPLAHPYEYLETARSMNDVPAALDQWISRIPLDSTDNWPTHVAGHPPLATLFFVFLDRIGVTSDLGVALVVVALASSAAVAVLVALRALDAESMARRAAPFLALTPAAVFLAVSGDAVFTAVAAWGIATLALAATAASRARMATFSVLSGLLLGSAVMMSYGLPILGVLALAVLLVARSWWPLPIAAGAALVVVLVFAAYGFAWWEAYPVLKDRYWDGLAQDRPGAYWMWGDLGSLLLSGGPLLGAGLAVLRRGATAAERVVVWLGGAAFLMIAIADLSQMSRAEVERIWLPFIPWLTVSLALLPPRWRRWGLGVQLLTALLVEHLFSTSW